MRAANLLDLESSQPRQQKIEVDPRDRLFVHMRYHTNGITRQQIRAAFDRTCNNFRGTEAFVEQMTVAFSRPKNLKDELTSARFHPAESTTNT